jgi:hypothetical protein
MQDLLIGCGLRVGRKLGVTFVSLCILASAGCYHTRVLAPHPDPATEYQSRTVNTLAWGLYKGDVQANDCSGSNALDEVRVSSNLGYNLVTTITLGFWQPLKVEWRCSKPHEEPGVIHKPKPQCQTPEKDRTTQHEQ